jgi:hypothetical protein
MSAHQHIRRCVALLAAVAAVAGLAVAVPSAAGAAERNYCTATITGQKKTGEYTLGPVTCGASESFTIASIIAVHYVDINFGGAALSIQGGACNGGWLNLPAGWINTVSSTWSVCSTTHYDLYNLGGATETLGPGGGNLSALHDRTNSVRYT